LFVSTLVKIGWKDYARDIFCGKGFPL